MAEETDIKDFLDEYRQDCVDAGLSPCVLLATMLVRGDMRDVSEVVYEDILALLDWEAEIDDQARMVSLLIRRITIREVSERLLGEILPE